MSISRVAEEPSISRDAVEEEVAPAVLIYCASLIWAVALASQERETWPEARSKKKCSQYPSSVRAPPPAGTTAPSWPSRPRYSYQALATKDQEKTSDARRPEKSRTRFYLNVAARPARRPGGCGRRGRRLATSRQGRRRSPASRSRRPRGLRWPPLRRAAAVCGATESYLPSPAPDFRQYPRSRRRRCARGARRRRGPSRIDTLPRLDASTRDQPARAPLRGQNDTRVHPKRPRGRRVGT